MDIEKIVKALLIKYKNANEEKSKQSPETDASYWMHLGQANEIGDLISFLIEEHQKENTLSDYLNTQLQIFKTT